MKKAKKVLLLALCAVLLVGATIAGTVAYLTAKTAEVKNTFTSGNVAIDLKEYDVDPQTGKKDPTDIVTGLEDLKLIPGREIEKNPFVTVPTTSEDCYVFVKIVNGLGEAVTINGMENWVELDNGYYRYKDVVTAAQKGKSIDVFTSITCANVDFSTIATETITITAYAVQSEGVDEATAYDTAKGLQ